MIKDVINLTKNGWNESNIFGCNDKVHISAENIEMNGVLKEDNQNAKLVNILKNEENKLINKIEKALNEENFGTYKNLISALTNISDIIDKKDWQIKHSEYETNGHKEVAIWEQDSNRNIRNYKNWTIKTKPSIIKLDGNIYTKEELITKIKNNDNTQTMFMSIYYDELGWINFSIVKLTDNKKELLLHRKFTGTIDGKINEIEEHYFKYNIDVIIIDKNCNDIIQKDLLNKFGKKNVCLIDEINVNDLDISNYEKNKIINTINFDKNKEIYITLFYINSFINKYMS